MTDAAGGPLEIVVAQPTICRQRFRVRGIVQGVGFRPYVYGLATRLGLGGFVLNDSGGVLIEVEGTPAAVGEFRSTLVGRPPPLATIDSLEEEGLEAEGGAPAFRILASEHGGLPQAAISPDVATCEVCLEEIRDPHNRRFRYPFTNCTDCGPRFTIATGIPYDRPNTTMGVFEMCPSCRAEYEDPADRRFHAQPIACPRCGPQLRLVDANAEELDCDPLSEVAALIARGAVIAVKGLGGYHLACLASDEEAVTRLRARKAREEKPFALMAGSLDRVNELVRLEPGERASMLSRRRPIVLAARRSDAWVARGVAPENRYLGIMLPYTPLHHLLLDEIGEPIVLTSANLSDQPIVYRDEDAFRDLKGIADGFLTHNRAIHVRCDDSVVRVFGGVEQPIRRARGYAPGPILLEQQFLKPTLGAGPEMKHTFCLGVGRRAILSHHIGDVESWESMSAFLEAVEHFQRVFELRPEVVAYDLHPEYLVTKWARALDGVKLIGVQHHHAHVGSCLADNGRSDRVIGLALDGTGFGEDGAIWGGEVMVCDLVGYRRIGHLRYMPLPGGVAAIRQPWRMAAVYLEKAFGAKAQNLSLDFVRRTLPRWKPILQMSGAGINSPLTSSAGRLFDAAAALAGIRDQVSYEGQAAIELEQAADPSCSDSYPCPINDGVLDGVALIASMAEDLAAGRPVHEAASAFHNGLASALISACRLAAEAEPLRTVVLSGGTFQNQLLAHRVTSGLEDAGFEVLVHHRVPPNDGGISLGQAVIANARIGEGLEDRRD